MNIEEQKEKERAEAERNAKIVAIEGLDEIRDAIKVENEYIKKYDKMIEDGDIDGAIALKLPDVLSARLKDKYPRADAYLKAESWSRDEQFVKSDYGRKAMERIINGDDYKQAIKDMEDDYNSYIMEHIFD